MAAIAATAVSPMMHERRDVELAVAATVTSLAERAGLAGLPLEARAPRPRSDGNPDVFRPRDRDAPAGMRASVAVGAVYFIRHLSRTEVPGHRTYGLGRLPSAARDGLDHSAQSSEPMKSGKWPHA
jgi:hypothetical protein